jgi:subtilisin family serine protease
MVGHRSLSLALLLLALLPASAAANPGTEIIVKRDAGLSGAERADIRADADVRFVETLPLPRTEVVAAAPGDVNDALRDLNADPDVAYAELNRPVRALTNDEHFTKLWGLQNLGNFAFGSESAVNDADMDVPEAWDHGLGTGRTVAVVDTGVQADHPDLGDRVAFGWDFVDEDPYANDEEGHGTHVAGTIAATKDNTIGVAGVAPEARILPLRVLDENGQGDVADAIEAYHYAAQHDVAIVNASLGGEGFVQSERDAIALHPEVLFVVAAGNDGENNDVPAQDPDYPCSYNLPNILCVGASKHNDQRAEFSNYGATAVDVFAPGYGIYSTIPGSGYDFNSGTSMATPHVAGLAALMLSRNPMLAPLDVKDATILSADQKPAFAGLVASGGRANAKGAFLGYDWDNDTVSEGQDNCPSVPNPGQEDVDLDGVGDACPPVADADTDGVTTLDDCPVEPAAYATNGCPSADPTADGDYWPDSLDQCLGQAGTARGCPDADADGVADASDNCVAAYNPGQADLDSDGQGNACDSDRDGDGLANDADQCPEYKAATSNGCAAAPPTPPTPTPPADRDGDGVYDLSDACPAQFARTADGCPAAQVSSVSASVRKRGQRRSAKVTIKTTRPASVRVIVERKRGRRWVRVKRTTLVITGDRATLALRSLKRGRHRIRIAITSSSGTGTPVTKAFRVR